MMWFLIIMNLVLIIALAFVVVGHLNLSQMRHDEAETFHSIYKRQLWNIEERVTVLNERVNNIKMRFKC